MRNKRRIVTTTVVGSALLLCGSAMAAPSWCTDGPPCKGGPGGGGEPVGTNNLSYPVIWSDNILESDFAPSTTPWVFAEITTPATECVLQAEPVSTVDADIACYYGERNLGIDEETGLRMFEPPTRTWWLQQRQGLGNSWQSFSMFDETAEAAAGTTPGTPVVITGVDTGDLLESSITINAKQIRLEYTLLKRVEGDATLGNATDDDYVQYLAFGSGTCVPNDNSTLAPNNCMVTLGMSGAVPNTDQSINEIQGTNYADLTLSEGLLDPQTIKTVKNYFDPDAIVIAADEPDPRIVAVDPPVGMDATVYSVCARLVIQPITDSTLPPVWFSDASGGVAYGNHGGYWTNGLGAPVVDIAAWDTDSGVGGNYSAEINAGGSLIYGYNWNTKLLSFKGDYRITFVLEGDACPYDLNTVFDATTLSVNVGERRPATVVAAGHVNLTGGEGGLAYVDVNIGTSGGGGRNR